LVYKEGKGASAILQPFHVGDQSAPFDSEKEMFWCPLIPAFENLFLGEAIKGYIQFHRIKKIRIVFKPLFLGKFRGIEDSIPPMGIAITACSDEDHN
jgi:hypothetical protein